MTSSRAYTLTRALCCSACKLAKEKRDEVAKRKRMGMANPSRLFQTVDSYWLEGEINSKINLLRQQQAVLMQDPIVRLKHEMEKATNMGDIKAAAKAAEMLKQEQHKVDVERMQKKLESECKFKRIEEENLKKNDVVAYLESRLDQQVVPSVALKNAQNLTFPLSLSRTPPIHTFHLSRDCFLNPYTSCLLAIK